MVTDPHGRELSPFVGKMVKGTLYDQPMTVPEDYAQWLANMGHRVSILDNKGALEVVKKEELPEMPIKR